MKKILASLFCLAALSSNAEICTGWTEADTNRQLIATGLFLADWGQTKDIKNHPGVYEINPFLGKNPTNGEINRHFTTVILAHGAISCFSNKNFRVTWQRTTIVLETIVVTRNAVKFGLSIKM